MRWYNRAMPTYQLYVKVARIWKWEATIEASDHQTAFREAISMIKPEHYDKAIRLEQEDTPSISPAEKID